MQRRTALTVGLCASLALNAILIGGRVLEAPGGPSDPARGGVAGGAAGGAEGGSPGTEADAFPFLARRALTDARNVPLINFVGLRRSIDDYVRPLKNRIGVYFQYLPTGITVGYNHDQPFVSASLLKLPTVMKVYELIEEGRVLKSTQMELTPDVIDRGYGTLWRKGLGARVTVEEAIIASLVVSDNTAHRLLYGISGGRPADIYRYLDVALDTDRGEPAIAPRNYASILRSLYYSAFLSNEHSNEILQHLTRAVEGSVLRSSIPADIPIAQKIGVMQFDKAADQTYSYCGIVYVPKRPYVLCIMVVEALAVADKQTADLSKLVYDYVSTR
jgi:beta-lactamase class A